VKVQRKIEKNVGIHMTANWSKWQVNTKMFPIFGLFFGNNISEVAGGEGSSEQEGSRPPGISWCVEPRRYFSAIPYSTYDAPRKLQWYSTYL